MSNRCECICCAGRASVSITMERPWNRHGPAPEQTYHEYWLKRVRARTQLSSTGCWIWQGPKNKWGYGWTCYRKAGGFVHRLMYQITHSTKLTRNQFVCHSCDVPACCNPDHLWLGDGSSNQLDASRKKRHWKSKNTHCPQGHEYDLENTYMAHGKRICRTCRRIRRRIADGWTKERAFQ